MVTLSLLRAGTAVTDNVGIERRVIARVSLVTVVTLLSGLLWIAWSPDSGTMDQEGSWGFGGGPRCF